MGTYTRTDKIRRIVFEFDEEGAPRAFIILTSSLADADTSEELMPPRELPMRPATNDELTQYLGADSAGAARLKIDNDARHAQIAELQDAVAAKDAALAEAANAEEFTEVRA